MADEKVKFLMRIDPDTDQKIKNAIPLANCRSQNEFVEKTLQFYCDYERPRTASLSCRPCWWLQYGQRCLSLIHILTLPTKA